MPTVSQGDITQITLDGRIYGQRTLTVLHYKVADFATTVELEEHYTGINSAMFGTLLDFEDKYLACCSNNFTLTRILTQVIYPIRYYARELFQSGKAGTVSSVSLPPGVSVSLTKRSLFSTSHSIGGVRMPAVPTTFTAAGELTSVGRTAYSILCDAIAAPQGTVAVNINIPIIFRRANPSLSEEVFTAFPQNTIRTMSRRVVQRGE